MSTDFRKIDSVWLRSHATQLPAACFPRESEDRADPSSDKELGKGKYKKEKVCRDYFQKPSVWTHQ